MYEGVKVATSLQLTGLFSGSSPHTHTHFVGLGGEGCTGVAALAIRMPDGQRVTRRFLETHKFKVVQDYLMTQGVDVSQHTVATTFPRAVISEGEKTLGELGLAPQMTLIVEPM